MARDENVYREALVQIAEIAADLMSGAAGSEPSESSGAGGDADMSVPGCAIKELPARLRQRSVENAVEINPVNAPPPSALGLFGGVPTPQSLTLLTSKYWGSRRRTLSVSFMESTPDDLRRRIVGHLNAWGTGVRFALTTGTGNVRISRGPGGYWSYLGTDVGLIPLNRPTMNLQGFTMNTSDREFHRVVRHEGGHTLGFPHEHMRRELVARIDPEKAYEYFQRTQGWSRQMVDQQVLTPLDQSSIFGTPADQDSIMCYQLPGSITRDGQPIRGGLDINATDASFARRVYPRFVFPWGADEEGSEVEELVGSASADDWDESEDVPSGVLEAV